MIKAASKQAMADECACNCAKLPLYEPGLLNVSLQSSHCRYTSRALNAFVKLAQRHFIACEKSDWDAPADKDKVLQGVNNT